MCCSEHPEGRSRWTLKLLANQLVELEIMENVSPATVGRALKKNELKPWKKKEWGIPPAMNAEFVCRMEDVLDIYKRQYDEKNPVVRMDETSKQLTRETKIPLPMEPGLPERYDT